MFDLLHKIASAQLVQDLAFIGGAAVGVAVVLGVVLAVLAIAIKVMDG